jgi:hypothetical protein
MKIQKLISIFIVCTFLCSGCSNEDEYSHNYVGKWAYYYEFMQIVYIFDDSYSQYSRYSRGLCDLPIVTERSQLVVEEYARGILKITQDSCRLYRYDFNENMVCDSIPYSINSAEIVDGKVPSFNGVAKNLEFYMMYLVEGNIMKVKYALDPDDFVPGFGENGIEFIKMH